jgi:hypothetical protein
MQWSDALRRDHGDENQSKIVWIMEAREGRKRRLEGAMSRENKKFEVGGENDALTGAAGCMRPPELAWLGESHARDRSRHLIRWDLPDADNDLPQSGTTGACGVDGVRGQRGAGQRWRGLPPSWPPARP